jgi:hypothetical protein
MQDTKTAARTNNSFGINNDVVGAGRFERPTPCAQGGYKRFAKVPHFQIAGFIGDVRSLLKAVELY